MLYIHIYIFFSLLSERVGRALSGVDTPFFCIPDGLSVCLCVFPFFFFPLYTTCMIHHHHIVINIVPYLPTLWDIYLYTLIPDNPLSTYLYFGLVYIKVYIMVYGMVRVE